MTWRERGWNHISSVLCFCSSDSNILEMSVLWTSFQRCSFKSKAVSWQLFTISSFLSWIDWRNGILFLSASLLLLLFKWSQLAEEKLWKCSVRQVASHLTALAGQLWGSYRATPPPPFCYWPSLLSGGFSLFCLCYYPPVLFPLSFPSPFPRQKSGEGRRGGGQPRCPFVSDNRALPSAACPVQAGPG